MAKRAPVNAIFFRSDPFGGVKHSGRLIYFKYLELTVSRGAWILRYAALKDYGIVLKNYPLCNPGGPGDHVHHDT